MRESTQITYGDGIVSVELISESMSEIPAPAVRFGDYEQVLESCFTQKELQEIYEGDHANLTFSFTMSDNPREISEYDTLSTAVTDSAKELGKLSEGVIVKMSAIKSVGTGEENSLDNLSEDVDLQVEIPLYLIKDNREYYWITDSLGACRLYKDQDAEADTLSINTSSVGTSILLYQDAIQGTATEEDIGFCIKPQYVFVFIIVLLLALWHYVMGIYKGRIKGREIT